MKVVEIEVHEITPEYHDWIAYPLNHYYGPTQRTVYLVHTDNGLLGLGEGGGAPEPQETLDHFGHGHVRLDGPSGRRTGLSTLRPEATLVGTGGLLDSIDASRAHGRGGDALCRGRLHLA